jgi:hypothetical protein
MLTIGSKYSIGFPRGTTTPMTLKETHEAKEKHHVLYTFIDNNGIKILFTLGASSRLKIVLCLPDSPPINGWLGDDEPVPPPGSSPEFSTGFAVNIFPVPSKTCMPLPIKNLNDWVSDDDLYN